MDLFQRSPEENKKESKGKRNKTIGIIRMQREPTKVKDLIELKLKYIRKEERDKRKEYAKFKKEMSLRFQKDGKGKKLCRMIRREAKDTILKWKKGIKRSKKRLEWSKKKII